MAPPESTASVFRFIHTHADTEALEEQVRNLFPNASDIQAEPMTLRTIFLTLAKSSRHAGSEPRMIQSLHIFGKDVRHLWPDLVLYAVLLLSGSIVTPMTWDEQIYRTHLSGSSLAR